MRIRKDPRRQPDLARLPEQKQEAALAHDARRGGAMSDVRLNSRRSKWNATLCRTGHIGMSDELAWRALSSLGGSDAKIIMSGDQKAIERLWSEKRGEKAPMI